MRAPKLFSFIGSTVNDYSNPVMVKELYQAVNGKITTGILLLFLLVQVLIILVPVSLADDPGKQSLGREIFVANNIALMATCVVIVPLIVGGRFRKERSQQNLDLMFITSLSPSRVIRGKWLAGLAFTILIYSVCAPFMTLTWLLRGVGLDMIIAVIAFGFMASALGIYLVIMIEAIPSNKLIGSLKMIIALGGLVMGCGLLISLTGSYAYFGSEITAEIWAWIFGIFLAALLIVKISATALISPTTYNVTLPLKLWLTIFWVIGLALSQYYLDKGNEGVMIGWIFVTWALLSFGIILSVFASPKPSLRIRGQIPRSKLLRLIVFPYYHTSVSSLLWCGVILAVTFSVAFSNCNRHLMGFFSMKNLFAAWLVVPIYLYGYAMTAMLLARALFRDHVKVGVMRIFLILIVGAILVPLLLGTLFMGYQVYDSIFMITNPFWPMMHSHSDSVGGYLALGTIWSIILTLVSMGIFIGGVREFKPLPKKVDSEDA